MTTPKPVNQFHTTRWSIVIGVGQLDSQKAKIALADLCQLYWLPLYSYLRRTGSNPADAEDIVQSFIAMLLERRDLESLSPEKGRFRSFLLASLKHYLSNLRDQQRTLKRGGSYRTISIEIEADERRLLCEPIEKETPESCFQRQWALMILDRVKSGLRTEFAAKGREEQFLKLEIYLTSDRNIPGYAEVATELGMTEAAIKMAVSRMRKRFREILREEIAQTVSSEEEIDDEIHCLISALQSR
ncbi:sigma factor [uncultured Rubinisphaera sp.]|uniref:RNA polymerase sigma factor n=1 Tax=uncultured Rubinisphaera sp. TaxID=1678686 RepID=UPI0030DC4DF7